MISCSWHKVIRRGSKIGPCRQHRSLHTPYTLPGTTLHFFNLRFTQRNDPPPSLCPLPPWLIFRTVFLLPESVDLSDVKVHKPRGRAEEENCAGQLCSQHVGEPGENPSLVTKPPGPFLFPWQRMLSQVLATNLPFLTQLLTCSTTTKRLKD